jgi:hypothetical protein
VRGLVFTAYPENVADCDAAGQKCGSGLKYSYNFTVAGNDVRGNLNPAGISNAASSLGMIYGNLTGN